MHEGQWYAHSKMIVGYILMGVGLLGDCALGYQLLQGADIFWMLLHIPLIALWGLGIILSEQDAMPEKPVVHMANLAVSKVSLTALFLGLLIFPGLGSLIFSVVLCITRYLKAEEEATVEEERVAREQWLAQFDGNIQPLVDLLPSRDAMADDSVITLLEQQDPASVSYLLRQLLINSRVNTTGDGSPTLTRLEEGWFPLLNTTPQDVYVSSENEALMLRLADQYYTYACNNTLQEESKRACLVQARDLVQQILQRHDNSSALWMRRVRILRRLGSKLDLRDALFAARQAIQLQPTLAEPYLAAVDVCFLLHDWQTLIDVATEGMAALPEHSEGRALLHWWLMSQLS